jgi:hypothetical protein
MLDLYDGNGDASATGDGGPPSFSESVSPVSIDFLVWSMKQQLG